MKKTLNVIIDLILIILGILLLNGLFNVELTDKTMECLTGISILACTILIFMLAIRIIFKILK